MSETPSQQPKNPSPSPYMERYGYEPTYANLDHGIADMPDDQLASLQKEYLQVFTNLSNEFSEVTDPHPAHPGTNSVQEEIIGKAADRYMLLTEESNRRNTSLTDEERARRNERAAAEIRDNIDLMNSGIRLDAMFSEYVDGTPLSDDERKRAEEIAGALWIKAYKYYRQQDEEIAEAKRLADSEERDYLLQLGGSALVGSEGEGASTEDDADQHGQDEQAVEAAEQADVTEPDEETPEQAVARSAGHLEEALGMAADDDESDLVKRLSLSDLETSYREYIINGGDEEAAGAQAARERMEQLRDQLAKPGDSSSEQIDGGEAAPKAPDVDEAAPAAPGRRVRLSNEDAVAIRAQAEADLAERRHAGEAQKSPEERLADYQTHILDLSTQIGAGKSYNPLEALTEVSTIIEGLMPLFDELPGASENEEMRDAFAAAMSLREQLLDIVLERSGGVALTLHPKGRRGRSYTPNPIGGPSDRGRRGNRADDASRGVNLASGFGLSGNAREDFDTVKTVAVRGARRVRSGASALNQRRQAAQHRRAEAQQTRLNTSPPPPAEDRQPNPDMPLPPPTGQYLRDLRPGEELPDAPTPPPPTEADASAPGSSQLPPPTGDYVRGPRDGEVLPPPPTAGAAQTQPEGPRPEEPRDAVLDYLAEKSPLFRLARAAENRNRRGRQARTQQTPPPPGPGDVAPGADLSSIPAPTDASANNTAEAA